MATISYSEAFRRFNEYDAPAVIAKYGTADLIAMSEAWHDFTDMLCKDGDMTDLQYHYCPAVDDNCDMDDDETLEYILDSMGVKFSHGPMQATRGDGNMSDLPRHWLCTIERGSKSFFTWFSQGSGHREPPTRETVLASLYMDAAGVDGNTFKEWCNEFDYDDDSRKAERIYSACKLISHDLERIFSESEMNDLREHFDECGL